MEIGKITFGPPLSEKDKRQLATEFFQKFRQKNHGDKRKYNRAVERRKNREVE